MFVQSTGDRPASAYGVLFSGNNPGEAKFLYVLKELVTTWKNQYKWAFIGDDDTYFVMSNVRSQQCIGCRRRFVPPHDPRFGLLFVAQYLPFLSKHDWRDPWMFGYYSGFGGHKPRGDTVHMQSPVAKCPVAPAPPSLYTQHPDWPKLPYIIDKHQGKKSMMNVPWAYGGGGTVISAGALST